MKCNAPNPLDFGWLCVVFSVIVVVLDATVVSVIYHKHLNTESYRDQLAT